MSNMGNDNFGFELPDNIGSDFSQYEQNPVKPTTSLSRAKEKVAAAKRRKFGHDRQTTLDEYRTRQQRAEYRQGSQKRVETRVQTALELKKIKEASPKKGRIKKGRVYGHNSPTTMAEVIKRQNERRDRITAKWTKRKDERIEKRIGAPTKDIPIHGPYPERITADPAINRSSSISIKEITRRSNHEKDIQNRWDARKINRDKKIANNRVADTRAAAATQRTADRIGIETRIKENRKPGAKNRIIAVQRQDTKQRGLGSNGSPRKLKSQTHAGLPSEQLVIDLETTGLEVDRGRAAAGRPTQAAATFMKDGIEVPAKSSNTYYINGDNKDLYVPGKYVEKTHSKGVQITGHTESFLKSNGAIELSGPDGFSKFVEDVHAHAKSGGTLSGHNIEFDLEFMEDTYARLNPNAPKLVIDRTNAIDTMKLRKGEILGIFRGVDKDGKLESLESFYSRVDERRASGYTLEETATIKKIDVEKIKINEGAKLHNARVDTIVTGKVTQAMKLEHEEVTIARVFKTIKIGKEDVLFRTKYGLSKMVKPLEADLAKALKGYGFFAGAIGAGVAYAALGRSPAREKLEKIGASKDHPFLDAAVAGGATYGLHRVLKHQPQFPGLGKMFDKALNSEAPIKSFKSQAFKFSGFGLVSYSAIALGHNMINNDPGEGWRYPLLTAMVGITGVYADTIYNAYNGKIEDIAADAHKLYRENIVNLKDAPWSKAISGKWTETLEGKAIAGEGKAVGVANSILEHTAKSGPAKFMIGLGLVGGLFAALSSGESDYNAEPLVETGTRPNSGGSYDNGNSRAMAQSMTSYRPSRRYNQSYRNTNSYSQPHGLGLV